MTDWHALAAAKQARNETPHGELDERALVRLGNTAYAAGLALLMAGSADASVWLSRAAERWRASWELAGPDAWGRPVGVLKASLLSGDEAATATYVRWTLDLGPERSPSPIGRYAAALALLAGRRLAEARPVAASLCDRDDFPPDVGEALAGLAAGDPARVQAALASVVASFETRSDHLEDVPVADTALALHALARLRGLTVELPSSPMLPAR